MTIHWTEKVLDDRQASPTLPKHALPSPKEGFSLHAPSTPQPHLRMEAGLKVGEGEGAAVSANSVTSESLSGQGLPAV